jgi:hypothetical protein
MESDDLIFDVESNDDDTEVALVVRSLQGRKIHPQEFVMLLEQYLHEITQAEAYRIRTGAVDH